MLRNYVNCIFYGYGKNCFVKCCISTFLKQFKTKICCPNFIRMNENAIKYFKMTESFKMATRHDSVNFNTNQWKLCMLREFIFFILKNRKSSFIQNFKRKDTFKMAQSIINVKISKSCVKFRKALRDVLNTGFV
jgi:hypothetical protein